jgi:hypothetical protein
MMMKWIDDRCSEMSSKIGAILAACAGAATVANQLGSPWNYVAFTAAIALVIFPEKS